MNDESEIRVIPLKDAPGAREAWSRPVIVVALWILVEYFFVTNALQPSSKIRAAALRVFGAKIGNGVILRPRLRVKFPWNLEIGNDSWIGEGVWIHNQNKVTIGHDVCISQETFITTGSHDFRKDMALQTRPVVIEHGSWICSRAIITAGSTIGESAIIPAGYVASGSVGKNQILGRGSRFGQQNS
jgi:putative colanic acid biosynthesis acetyltransferase WcaF